MRTWGESVASLLLLGLGGAIYLLFRPQNILMFKVLDALELTPCINRWREMTENVSLPDFVIYCLPNGLWTAAYIVLIDGWLYRQTKKVRFLAAVVIPLIGTTAEMMQAVGWLPGTFDCGDIACLMLPLLAYGILLTKDRWMKKI